MTPQTPHRLEFSRNAQKKILFFNGLIGTRFACETTLRTVAQPDPNRCALSPAAKEF